VSTLDDFLYGANVAMSVLGMEDLQNDSLLVNSFFFGPCLVLSYLTSL
jgi:hypothetical protein